jgi:hypothetical protein
MGGGVEGDGGGRDDAAEELSGTREKERGRPVVRREERETGWGREAGRWGIESARIWGRPPALSSTSRPWIRRSLLARGAWGGSAVGGSATSAAGGVEREGRQGDGWVGSY